MEDTKNIDFALIQFDRCQKKHVNQDSHIASSSILQSSFFEEVWWLILAFTQRTLRGYNEFLKFRGTIKKIKKFKFI